MDRFIVGTEQTTNELTRKFKIQYGQIYSREYKPPLATDKIFKIQYGQIYSFDYILFDEFITRFKIQYGQIYRRTINNLIAEKFDLKSNMDRFIDFFIGNLCLIITDLKSNMDRFIGVLLTT